MRKDKNIEKKNKKETIRESLQLHKDIMLGALKVTMTGNQEAWIEN